MSFSFTIAGHSPNPHNDQVKSIVFETVQKLKALEGSVSVTGYTYDSSGVNFSLDDVFIAGEEARLAAPPEETQASEPAPAESGTSAETVNTPAPAEPAPNEPVNPSPVPDSTESAPTAPTEGA